MNTKNNYIADIIIVSYKNPDITVQCVQSIRSNNNNSYNIIIVDNASPDNTVDVLRKKLKDVNIIENNENKGYAAAVNKGAEYCLSEFIVISNNDVIYKKGVPDKLISELMNDEKIGAIGPAQEYADGSWQISSGDFPGLKLSFKHLFMIEQIGNLFKIFQKKIHHSTTTLKNFDYIDGAVLVTRKQIFDKLGGFDERFSFYSEEADFCYRVKQAGYRIVNDLSLTVTHLRGGADNLGNLKTENIYKLVASKVLFSKKHDKRHTKLYIKIEKLHSFLYAKLINFVSVFFSGAFKRKLKEKARVLNDFYNAWQNELKNYG